MSLDYAAILSQAQNLTPDYQDQRLRGQEAEARTQQIDLQRQAMQIKLAEAQREREKQAAFEAERDQVLLNPDPKRVALLALKYPDQFKGAKEGFDLLDADRRTNDLTQMGSVYSRAKEGDFKGAAAALRTRIEADKAAGQDVTEDEHIADALESGDAIQQRAALGTIGMHIAAVAPKEFAETWGKLSGGDGATPTDLEKKYRFLIGERGQAYADQWLSEQTQDVVVGQPGAPVYRKSDIIGGNGFKQGGGDPASIGGRGIGGSPGPTVPPIGNAKEVVESLFPGAKVTDWKRPAGSKLGKANPNSWHVNSGAAVDVRPIPGMTFGEFVGKIAAAGHPIIEQRDEVTNPSKHATGPHWHVVIGQGGPGAKPVSVRSIQEAMKLPKGTHYRNPQGREFVR